MKNLNSKILRIQEIIGVSSMLMEASKKDVLIKKLGIKEELAQQIDELCGGLSVILTNKIIDFFIDTAQEGRQKSIDLFNRRGLTPGLRQSITSIMDWVRVGLNGNLNQYKDYSFKELIELSKKWHDSLQLGQGSINYEEKNKIISDFRDENGNGFYWVDLNTNSSDEECQRMGHCGRTGGNNFLVSLRETSRFPGGKYTINKSHLTAAISYDGILYQLKGVKNSKPKDEFHKYILPLFYLLGGGGEQEDFLIRGFGSEYASYLDFKITDLPKETIKELYIHRPELFESRSLKRKLIELGLIEKEHRETVFTLKLSPTEIGDYVDGDYRYSTRKWTDPNGNKRETKIYFFEMILSEPWDLWNNYDADWESAVQYYVNDDNGKKIINHLLSNVEDKSEYESLDLESLIEELDDDNEVRNSISSVINDAESNDYVNSLRKALESALEDYGTVNYLNDEGAEIVIDLDNLTSNVDDTYLDEIYENCSDDDLNCIFDELIYNGYIDKPNFRFDDRYYPDVDKNTFNEYLSDRLSDIM